MVPVLLLPSTTAAAAAAAAAIGGSCDTPAACCCSNLERCQQHTTCLLAKLKMQQTNACEDKNHSDRKQEGC